MLISVYVKPGSSRTSVGGTFDDRLIVSVTSAAVDGAANSAVIAALAKALEISKRDIRIKSGLTSKRKIIEVENCDPASISVLRNQE